MLWDCAVWEGVDRWKRKKRPFGEGATEGRKPYTDTASSRIGAGGVPSLSACLRHSVVLPTGFREEIKAQRRGKKGWTDSCLKFRYLPEYHFFGQTYNVDSSLPGDSDVTSHECDRIIIKVYAKGRCVVLSSFEWDWLPGVGVSGCSLPRMKLEGRQRGMQVSRVGTESNSTWALPLTSIVVWVKCSFLELRFSRL